MNNRIYYNFEKIFIYIESSKRKCLSFQQLQTDIETNFKKIGETWNDKIYDTTKTSLVKVSKSIELIHLALSNTFEKLIQYYNELNRIEESKRFVTNTKFPKFIRTLKEGDNYMNDFSKDSIVDLNAMGKYIESLGNYIYSVEKLMKDIKDEHEAIGRQKVWVAPQYHQLGNIINDINERIKKEMHTLRISQELTKRKKVQLEVLQNKKF